MPVGGGSTGTRRCPVLAQGESTMRLARASGLLCALLLLGAGPLTATECAATPVCWPPCRPRACCYASPCGPPVCCYEPAPCCCCGPIRRLLGLCRCRPCCPPCCPPVAPCPAPCPAASCPAVVVPAAPPPAQAAPVPPVP